MLFRSPPVNLPLITLPFFSSNESAIAAVTTRHITKTNRNICIRFILFVLCSAMTYLHNHWALWMIALAGDFYVFAPASRHAWLQYCWPCGTSQRHGMCAHFLSCWSLMENSSD